MEFRRRRAPARTDREGEGLQQLIVAEKSSIIKDHSKHRERLHRTTKALCLTKEICETRGSSYNAQQSIHII